MIIILRVIKNNAWNSEHNAQKLQEILNRIMQEIMSIITSALHIGSGLTNTVVWNTC